MRIAIAAGGTGGHIFPAIAVVEAMQELRDTVSLFIGSDRQLEGEILQKAGLDHVSLNVGRIKGAGWRERLKTVLTLPREILEARRILAKFAPDLVFGVGGYSSGPVILAALSLRLPRALLEPNAIPGFTNRMLGRVVQRIFVAFAETERFFPVAKVSMTGTPVRKKIIEIKKEETGYFTLLILGGSQGARSINQAVLQALPRLTGQPLMMIHQTGNADFAEVGDAYRLSKIRHEVYPFIEAMDQAYARADLVMSRAGAATISELKATCIPALLIPYPHAADDHQRFNALQLVEAGGAEVMMDQDLSGESLVKKILFYMGQKQLLQRMRANLEKLEGKKAAMKVAEECCELAHV